MSSAGTPHREQIFRTGGTGPGGQTIEVFIENDGIILTAQRLSGDSHAVLTICSQFPEPMDHVPHQTLQLKTSDVRQTALIVSRRIRLEASWSGTCEVGISVRSVSGSVIAAMNNISQDDLDAMVVINTQMLTALNSLSEQQQTMINHLRQITEINDDTGDTF